MTQPISYAIEANDLAKSFSTQDGEISLFRNLSFRIQKGESVAIIGQSGAGKSTLLSILAGLDTPSTGNVSLLGTHLHNLSDKERAQWRANNISFIFQSFHLLPELNAQENVQLPLEIRGESEAADKAANLLTQVGLEGRQTHFPSQLSGGEQQRVAIARAFVTQPSILFADEPTGNLDSDTGQKIIDQLFTLNQQTQTTLILITHDAALAARCQRQFVLDKGQLMEKED